MRVVAFVSLVFCIGIGIACNSEYAAGVDAKASIANRSTAADSGWGTIKGQVVFAGAKIPERPKLDVTKDQDHCLAKGPLLEEKWVVDPKTKGVQWAVVFLKPDQGATLPVHEKLTKPASPDVVVDQPACQFVPHSVVMRADQKLLAKNPAPVPHNIVITGFKNSHNIQIPSGKAQSFELVPETNAITLSCGAHPWMKGNLWVLEHPYFAVTDAEGRFEIKLAPAGNQNLVIWHEAIGYVEGGKKGKPIQVKADGVTELKIDLRPE